MKSLDERRAGYLIVHRADIAAAKYDQSDFAQENRAVLADLRRALSPIDPAQYRGVSRAPVDAEELTLLRSRAEGAVPQGAITEDDVIETFTLASFLLNRLPDASIHELIYIETGTFTETHETLGFDIGYWGGDHFSLIADVSIMPRWHPPPPEAFPVVADHLRLVNERVLFARASDAEQFLAFYRSQEWAETEFQGEFAILRVALPRIAV